VTSWSIWLGRRADWARRHGQPLYLGELTWHEVRLEVPHGLRRDKDGVASYWGQEIVIDDVLAQVQGKAIDGEHTGLVPTDAEGDEYIDDVPPPADIPDENRPRRRPGLLGWLRRVLGAPA